MSGAIAYGIALVCERVTALFLLSFLVGDLSEPRFAIWTQFIGAVALLNVVIIVRLDNGLLARLPQHPRAEAKSIFVCTLVSLIPIFLLFSIVTWTLKNPLSIFIFGNQTYADLINCMIFFSVAEGVASLGQTYLRIFQKIKLMALHYFFRFGGRAILLIVLLEWHQSSLEDALYILGFYTLVLGICPLIFERTNKVSPKKLLKELAAAFGEGRSQLVAATIYWLFANSDRYLVLHFLDLATLEKYAFLVSIAAPIAIAPIIIAQGAVPKLVSSFHNQKDRFYHDFGAFFGFTIFATLAASTGFICVADFLIHLLSVGQIRVSNLDILLIATFMFLTAIETTFGCFFLATSNSGKHAKTLIFCLPISLGLASSFVVMLGLSGILAAKIITSLLIMGLLVRQIPEAKSYFPKLKTLFIWALGALIMYVSLRLMVQKLDLKMSWTNLFFLVCFGATVYFFSCANFVKKYYAELKNLL